MSVFSFETILKIIEKICRVLMASLKALGYSDDDSSD